MVEKAQPHVGARIAAARRSKGMSQRQLAEAIDSSIRTVQTWEGRSRRNPRTETLLRIAELTDREVSWFYEIDLDDEQAAA